MTIYYQRLIMKKSSVSRSRTIFRLYLYIVYLRSLKQIFNWLQLTLLIRRTSGGNRSGLSSPYENPPAPSPHQQPGTKTTSAPTSPLKVLKKFMLSIQSSFFYHILAPNEFVENYCTVTISNCWFAGTAWEQESLILRQGFKSFTGEMS